MKLLPLCFLLFASCAETQVYRNGQLALRTQANASLLTFHQGDTDLRIEGMNHSTPTRAGGSVVGTAATGLAGVATAVLSKGLIR